MTDIKTVPRQPDREPASKPLVDEQLADQLLARAQTEGVELLGPDGLLSQVTKAVLERALGEAMTHHLGMRNATWPAAGRATAVTAPPASGC